LTGINNGAGFMDKEKLKRLVIIIGVLVVWSGLGVGCKKKETPTAQKPVYELIDPSRTGIDLPAGSLSLASIENVSMGNTKRYVYNVIIYYKFDKKALESIALQIYEQAKKKTPFNSLSVAFSDYPQFIGDGRFGVAHFAPNGVVGDAPTVKTGDYSSMKMENFITEPKWENALTREEADIIKTYKDIDYELSKGANTHEAVDAAEEAAIRETVKKYGITTEALDEMLRKYYGIFQTFSQQ
jgi:hypothetical protein